MRENSLKTGSEWAYRVSLYLPIGPWVKTKENGWNDADYIDSSLPLPLLV